MIKLLKKSKCYIVREGSNHSIWYSPITNQEFQLPRHPSQELATGTAAKIKKQAGLK